jgi:transposase
MSDKYKPKYDPAICDTLPNMFANGETIVEVCLALGISRRAFYDWKAKYPEFEAAVDQGMAISEAWWSKLGRAGAIGAQPVHPTLWIFNMKNRFNWTDKTDIGVSGLNGGPIQTENKIITSDMSAEDIAALYREELKKCE